MCRPKGSWFWSAWFRTGYPFQRRCLERVIKFRTHKSSSFVSSHLKLFKDRLLLKIRFNALTSKPLYSSWCTLCFSACREGVFSISRTGISFRANSRTGYKKMAHFLDGVSILGEIYFRTECQFGVPEGTYPPKKYPSAPPSHLIQYFLSFPKRSLENWGLKRV